MAPENSRLSSTKPTGRPSSQRIKAPVRTLNPQMAVHTPYEDPSEYEMGQSSTRRVPRRLAPKPPGGMLGDMREAATTFNSFTHGMEGSGQNQDLSDRDQLKSENPLSATPRRAANKPPIPEPIRLKVGGKYICPFSRCPNQHEYTNRMHCIRHIKGDHIYGRPYICEHCREDFKRSDSRNRHRKTCRLRPMTAADPRGGGHAPNTS